MARRRKRTTSKPSGATRRKGAARPASRPRLPGPTAGKRRVAPPDEGLGASETIPLLEERLAHPETTPALTGGDVDADWARASSTGEEAVGGSVATPDQDVVDEIGRALGVEQDADAEVRTSQEILEGRDRHYWHLERKAAEREES
jgi:hypothetical protein